MGNQNSRKLRDFEDDSIECKLPDNLSWNKTVPFIVPLRKGKVIKVYDGDTITVAAKLPQFNPITIYRFSIRIRGIDAPEMMSKNEEEKEMAIKARDALSKLVLNKYVTLDNLSSEKYSRILADVYCNGISIGDWMMNKRYAVPYDGTTKKCPSSWKKFFETGKTELSVEEETTENESNDDLMLLNEKIEKCVPNLEPINIRMSGIPTEIKGDCDSSNMQGNVVGNVVGNVLGNAVGNVGNVKNVTINDVENVVVNSVVNCDNCDENKNIDRDENKKNIENVEQTIDVKCNMEKIENRENEIDVNSNLEKQTNDVTTENTDATSEVSYAFL